ncbi:MAG: alpha/beta hydrolase-fold protein, partial [Planctomycetota bacterium]|nr:alpha/beta hydrolase-fold protein [Planctomycetota bacterium]
PQDTLLSMFLTQLRSIRACVPPFAAAAALTLALSTVTAGAQQSRYPGASIRSLVTASPSVPSAFGPRHVRIGVGISGLISSIAPSAPATPGLIPGRGGLALLVSILVEETQEEESFTIYVPPTPPGVERPLLAAFHGFNVSHLDIWANTSFIAECQARDWILVAPYQRNLAPTGPGTSQTAFGSAQSQLHVQAVIDYAMDQFAVDRDRVYGVGFSMGGGAALSYAARHRDRERGAFAAVVNHTGTVSLQNVYSNADTSVQQLMVRIFNGSPSFSPFEYSRASVINLDAAGTLVPGGNHMASNLAGVAVRTYYGIGDSQQYLIDQGQSLHALMGSLGLQHELVALPANCTPQQQGHCWSTIDETEVCDWLSSKSYQSPGPVGRILADRDGRWGEISVEPALSNEFAVVEYSVSGPQNSVRLQGTSNVDVIELDLADLGIDPLSSWSIRSGTLDGTADEFSVAGLPGLPLAVRRNGVTLGEECQGAPGPSWCFDASSGTLRISETSGVSAFWSVTP